MEDGAVRCRDQRKNGESEGWCAEDKRLHTGKRKCGFLEDMRGQAGQEGVSLEEVATGAAKYANTEVRMTTQSIAREHGKQGRNEERVIGSPKGRRSAYFVDNDDTREEPMEGTYGAKRVGCRSARDA